MPDEKQFLINNDRQLLAFVDGALAWIHVRPNKVILLFRENTDINTGSLTMGVHGLHGGLLSEEGEQMVAM